MIKRINQQIIITGGMGFIAYFFGGLSIFTGCLLFYIDLYEITLFLIALGIFLIGYRDRTVVDAENKMIVQKWGIFIVFIEKRTDLFEAPSAVRIRKYSTKSVAFRRTRTKIEIYCVEIMTLQGNIPVIEVYESAEGTKIVKEIAKLLGITHEKSISGKA